MNRTRFERSNLAPRLCVALGNLALATATAIPAHADPERRSSGLEDQPAVRHRLLLVKHRFELAPMFESTINADFRHILGGGLKLEYHLSDMISFGVIGVYSTSVNTALVDKIIPTLEDKDPDPPPPANPDDDPPDPDLATTREPSKSEFKAHLNEMPIHGAAFVSVTPWYGKLAAFSKAFLNFDFYFQAGVAFAKLESSCGPDICKDQHPGRDIPDPDGMGARTGLRDDDPNDDPPLNDGNRFGLYLAQTSRGEF